MTSYVFLWETPDGTRHWEAVKREQTHGFLENLLNSGVHPATVMAAYAPILFHWILAEWHKGLSDVNFHRINENIYGTTPEMKSKHEPLDVPAKQETPESKFGWIAPDGRFFGCDYGGHSSLAKKICGDIQYVVDPERHLENLGWAKVFSGSCNGERYALGMGLDMKLTDAQMRTLQRMELERAHGVSCLL